MGLFDSIRRVVGGSDASGADDTDDDVATQPDVIDTHDLDQAALRERAAGVAGEVDVLDFSLASLEQFDDAIDAGYDEDLATSDTPGLYATDTVRFGCYLGEVLVRTYDGEWTRNPDWGVTISGPDGTTTVAVFDVAERSITTGAVFAAVADRAAVEVGLDGAEPTDSAPPDDDPDAGTDERADAGAAAEDEPSTADPGEDEPLTDDIAAETADDGAAVEGLGDESAAETTEDEPTAADVDDDLTAAQADDEPDASEADDSTPATETPSDDPTAETPSDDPTAETADTETDVPDPASADSSLSEAAREAVERVMEEEETDSLIEEAEPGAAADDTGADTTPGDEPGDQGSGADPSGSQSQTVDAPDPSESLFDDETAGAGPTVADAPAAADGSPVGSSEFGSTDAAADSADAPSDDQSEKPAADPDPTEGDGLRATYAEAAEELVSFWTEYDLDYSPDSLARLDALVSAEWDDDRFDDAVFGSDDSFDDRVFTSVSTELGSYFGEVLVRELDAEWSDETTTDGVVVEGADGPLAIPVFKVAGTSITQQPVFARSYDSLLSDLDA